MKETRPEKAGMSQRDCERGVCVSQPAHLVLRATSPPTLFSSDIGTTRLRGIPEAG